MNIIALIGWKNTGKDTVAKYLVKRYNFYHMKFAQYIKDATGSIFPNIPLNEIEESYIDDLGKVEYWEIDKDTPREEFGGRTKRDVLIDLARYLKLTYGNDIFVNTFKRDLNLIYKKSPNLNIVISDLRFMVEFDWLRSLEPKVYFLDIERFDNFDEEQEIYTEYPLLKKEMLGNLNYEFNIICNNNCLQTFHKMIDKEINRIKLNV